jgi:hypothetical protein
VRRHAYTVGVVLSIAIASTYLHGCAAAVVGGGVYGVGRIILAKDRSPVYVTESNNEVRGCESIKIVEESSAWGGMFLQDAAMERVIAGLTNETAEAGGNVLLIRKKDKGFGGSSATGEAYRCPDNNTSAPIVSPK